MSEAFSFLKATKDEQVRVLFERARSSQVLSRKEALEIYANPKNWSHERLGDGRHGWVWRGPVIWAPEAAMWGLAPTDKEIEQFCEEWDRGEHQLSPEDAAALDVKAKEFKETLKRIYPRR